MRRLLVKLKGLQRELKAPFSQVLSPSTINEAAATDSEPKISKAIPPKKKEQRNILQQNAPLKSLPPEVRHHILSMLPLKELANLIHASAVFFQQYLLAHKTLLLEPLQQTLRGVTVDACTALRSDSPELTSSQRSKSVIADYLKPYQSKRTGTHYSIEIEELTEEEVFKMVKFQICIVQPLMRVYTKWALEDLSRQAGSTPIDRTSLSRTEEIRLMRAMHRFQPMCNLFGSGKYYKSTSRGSRFMPNNIHILFFALYESWEIEEIVCFHFFVTKKYD